VIQADGGTRTAAITGGYVALVLALRRLMRERLVHRNVVRTAVAAISVGIVGGEPVLDLSYAEDSRAEVDGNVVMTADRAFVEVQATAEGQPFPRSSLDVLLNLAEKGTQDLFRLQREVLGQL
jgi:ribonuclease PH